MNRSTSRPIRRALVLVLCAWLTLGVSVYIPDELSALRAAVSLGYVSEGRAPVAPGVVHDRGFIETDTAGRQAVHLLEVDARDPVITFEASISNDRITGLERTTAQANRRNVEGHLAVAAINADFWGARQEPLGLHIQAGELITAAPTARPTFGIKGDGNSIIGTPVVTATATRPDGGSHRIARVNQPRASGQLVLYTARYGEATGTDASGNEVVLTGVALPIAPHGAHSGLVSEVRVGIGNRSIGEDDVVLSGSGAAASFLRELAVGDRVSLSFSISPGWENVMQAAGGGQYILRSGVVRIEPYDPGFADVTHPRTGIGITGHGGVVIATVDGRQPGYSIGVRLDELAELLRSRGCVTAINLDGGGSTTMAVRLPGDDGVTAVNRGSDGFERAVSNSLLIFSLAPTGPLAIANIVPPHAAVLVGGQIDYTVKGQDAAYNAVPVPPDAISWSVTGTSGSIHSTGRFTSTASGVSTVMARILRVVGETEVAVVDTLSALDIQPNYAIVEPAKTQAFTLRGRSGHNADVKVNATQAIWSVAGPIGIIDATGVLTAADTSAGGSVIVTAGGITASARVDVGRPPAILEDFEDLTDMRPLAAGGTASLTAAMRPSPVRNGTRSGRLEYNFTASGTSAAYAVHSPLREIDGRPKGVGIWLYGDASGHWVRGHYRDGNNVQRVVDFTSPPTPAPVTREDCARRSGGIDWMGWKYLEAPLQLDAVLPLKWERVYVVETFDLCDNASAVYLDDLRAVYSDTGEDLVGPSVSELIPKPGSTVSQPTLEIGATIQDNPGGSGVAADSIRLLVDGTQVPARFDALTGLVRYTPTAPLSSGIHRIRLDATDNTGNPALPFGDWAFTVDTAGARQARIGGLPRPSGGMSAEACCEPYTHQRPGKGAGQ